MTTKTVTPAERFTIPGHADERLFDGWAVDAYSLPGGVVAHGRALVGFTAAAATAKAASDAAKAADGQVARLAAIDAAIAQAVETGAVPDDPTTPLLAARHAAEDATLRAELLRDIVNRESLNVEGVIGLSADEIAVRHLRPAFREVLKAVAAVARDLEGVDVASTAAVSAAGAGDAYLVLVEQEARLSAIHAGLEVLRARAHKGQEDDKRLFRDTRAFPGGPQGRTTNAGHSPAGPMHPLARLVWLATDPGADAWLPSLEEWTARYFDWFYGRTEGNRPEAVAAINEARQTEHDRMRKAYLESRA